MLARTLLSTLPKVENLETTFLSKEQWDISNAEETRKIIQGEQPDIIVNTAAYTKVDDAEKYLSQASEINHKALTGIALEAKKLGARVIHISTDYVFDGLASEPYSEDDPCFPLNNYGLTKRLGELALASATEEMVILRTSWLYTSIGNNFFRTILRLAKEKGEISIVSDQVSAPTYAVDLALVIWKIIQQEHKKIQGIFHFSNTGEASWFSFAKEIIALSDYNCTVHAIASSDYPQAAKRPIYSKLKTNKISEALSLSIPSWQDGVSRCWESYKNL